MTNPDTPQYYLGIDPGLTGAVSLVRGQQLLLCLDMPTITVNNKTRVNAHQLIQLFGAWSHQYGPAHAYVELAQAAPGQGASASFNYGLGFGTTLTALVANHVPYTLVPPAKWKRLAGFKSGAPKSASLIEARRRFPHKAHLFARQKDHGRAEAAIIAALGANGHLDK